MRLLSFDVGIAFGWACFEDGRRIGSGTFGLDDGVSSAEAKSEGKPERFERRTGILGRHLEDLCSHAPVDVIAYECLHLGIFQGKAAAFLHAGLLSQLTGMAYRREYDLMRIDLHAIKRAATGKSQGVEKTDIMAAAIFKWGSIPDLTSDEADALWCGHVACKELGL